MWPPGGVTPYDTAEAARAAHRARELRGAEDGAARGRLHQGWSPRGCGTAGGGRGTGAGGGRGLAPRAF